MKRVLALVAMAAAALALAAAAAASGPAVHFSESVVGDVIPCEGGLTLTAISGSLKGVIHEGTSASGNMNFTGTLVPKDVVFVGSDGNTYRPAGAIWFGGAFNAQQGTGTFTFTEHIAFVGPGGGLVGTIHITEHVSPNGNEVSVDFGTCEDPGEG
jgi:opacity protein-like surface antigen